MRGTWDDLNRRLTGAILALDLNDGLVIRERPSDSGRKGLFGSRKASRGPRRYVQVTAAPRVLIAECVGSTSFGGEWEMTPETEASLLEMGWEKPWSPDYRTFSREAPLTSANRIALATVRALQTLGCEMDDLEVELVHEEPS
ncbi:hypothetical protein [Nocardioides sp.]|uniref:TY-Chap domain-containing protein n=1 Tax=Nocardioides sp. TaxID=35761 RepID=UPI00271ED313|nr:hypothetical protein [Nocardioides sp.]MDO9455689.1 hypothetical protein [Nocardioides sp.]